MKVIWSEQAGLALRDTTKYINKEFGEKAKLDLMLEVRQFVHLLAENPLMGIEEPLLIGSRIEYRRYVINRLNKAVYYINSATDTIEIVAFWDTRREPKAQARHLR